MEYEPAIWFVLHRDVLQQSTTGIRPYPDPLDWVRSTRSRQHRVLERMERVGCSDLRVLDGDSRVDPGTHRHLPFNFRTT